MKSEDKRKVIALFVADLHLSLTAPVFRSNEPDWLAAQQRPLDELRKLQKHYDCPIFCAGDVFDKWNSPCELINWAIEHLPYMLCVPGQHDLPEHDLGQIERSAYWTLVKAKVIDHLGSEATSTCYDKHGFVIHSYPYGVRVAHRHKLKSDWMQIALIHEYNWVPGHKYPEAPCQQIVTDSRKEFNDYDLVVSGDNHSPFRAQYRNESRFINCGTFMRRKVDERTYAPSIWLLRSDGPVVQHALNTSEDKYLELNDPRITTEDMDYVGVDMTELIAGLGKLGQCTLDFAEALTRHLEKHPASKNVRSLIYKAMGK